MGTKEVRAGSRRGKSGLMETEERTNEKAVERGERPGICGGERGEITERMYKARKGSQVGDRLQLEG